MSGVDVIVVGGGPSGLSAAIELRRRGAINVIVLEREAEAGGAPRHTDHLGFGIRDMHRLLSGPRYARELRERAEHAGVDIRLATTAVDWPAPTSIQVADSRGLSVIEASAVVLATGVRERPRSARMIAGDRPAGVLTTGSLQQIVHVHRTKPGTNAVIVGAEHVSFSAIMTLRDAGVKVAAMVTPFTHHQTYSPLRLATATRHRVPVVTGANVAEIHGHGRVEAVTLTTGRRIDCDTVVFTGDWIPDHELARRGAISIDEIHRGAVIDGSLRTDRPGVFAIGNLTHPAETADVCALDGRHVAKPVAEWLDDGVWPGAGCRVTGASPILWISPAVVHPDVVPRGGHVFMRVSAFVERRSVVVTQADRVLWHSNIVNSFVPNRSIHISAEWMKRVDPDGGEITVALSTVPV